MFINCLFGDVKIQVLFLNPIQYQRRHFGSASYVLGATACTSLHSSTHARQSIQFRQTKP